MNIGILGTGSMGQTHVEAWAQTPARISAIVSRNYDNAQRLAQICGATAYRTLEDMLPHIDVLDICTPTPQHLEQTALAARAGKHVVCEKPIARTLDQAQRMLDVCAKANVKLLIAHVVRYFPAYADARERAEQGEIGAPKLLRLARLGRMPRTWFDDVSASGGVLLDLMIHDYDFARWVAGDVTHVRAMTADVPWPDAVTQHASVMLTHANGAVSHVEGSWANPPSYFRTSFDLLGDKGRIEYDTATAPRSAMNPYVAQAQALYNALAEDAPFRVAAQDGLEALRIALAAIQSAKTGQTVAL